MARSEAARTDGRDATRKIRVNIRAEDGTHRSRDAAAVGGPKKCEPDKVWDNSVLCRVQGSQQPGDHPIKPHLLAPALRSPTVPVYGVPHTGTGIRKSADAGARLAGANLSSTLANG